MDGPATPCKPGVPGGSVWVVQVAPPSVVTSEGSRFPGGTVWPVHVAPPSVVATTWPPPTAQQVLVEVQATPVRLPVPAGGACGVQTDPPSVVATTWPPVAPAVDPTA